MRIWISSLADVHATAKRVRPAHVVSLLSPGDEFPEIAGLDEGDHHRVHIHDIREERDGHVAPGEEHVTGLVEFLSSWRTDNPLLVHCWAGMSRSTATAFIAACLHNPAADESRIALAIADASPTAYPNTRIVSIADARLGRGGRMTAAAKEICEDQSRIARIMSGELAAPFHIPARF